MSFLSTSNQLPLYKHTHKSFSPEAIWNLALRLLSFGLGVDRGMSLITTEQRRDSSIPGDGIALVWNVCLLDQKIMESCPPHSFPPLWGQSPCFYLCSLWAAFQPSSSQRRKFEAKGDLARPCQETDDRMATHGLIW